MVIHIMRTMLDFFAADIREAIRPDGYLVNVLITTIGGFFGILGRAAGCQPISHPIDKWIHPCMAG